MPMSVYINLHSHRKPQIAGETVIRNAYTCSGSGFDSIPYFLSVGIHPWLINKLYFADLESLKEMLKKPNVKAIGECGIDRVKGPEIQIQLNILHQQLELAVLHSKPVILHIVKAYSDLPPLMKKYHFKGIVHGFKGNIKEAEMLLDFGFKLSFGYRIMQDELLANVFKQLPLDNIYLETDVKPLLISKIYSYAATLRSCSETELKDRIKQNFERDFLLVLPNE